ncbi:immunoglobulin-binding protein 1 [Electrophorus electricus]|uniref:Immunoglobulin (CD79A) binding protein 1 n=1 Tax=Electrophorus electricus TaxID=8005 RepID=A0A4W4EJR2_ELEEL|nr:immunoglobulin-binding protein 1 [Electrophorus electricus]
MASVHSGQTQNSEREAPKLSELLEQGWKLYEEVDSTNEPTASNPIQVKVKRGIMKLEEATRMVAQLDLFSRNEELEEVATADLKYLLLPVLLAALTLRQVSPAKRPEHLSTARVYFMDFLRRCKDYNISSFHMPADTPTGEESNSQVPTPRSQPDLIAMATQRRAKIERFQQRKATEARLAEVRVLVQGGSVDDEVLRELHLLQVRRWIPLAIEEVDSIDQELQILKRMDVLKQSSVQPSLPRKPPMKPFILTKDAVQAKVYGAGYPSLPTMTVDDWYEQHRRKGCLPDQGISQRPVDAEGEDGEKESREDDEEALQKARDWDDWKDTHRRGYGNRKNMG